MKIKQYEVTDINLAIIYNREDRKKRAATFFYELCRIPLINLNHKIEIYS